MLYEQHIHSRYRQIKAKRYRFFGQKFYSIFPAGAVSRAPRAETDKFRQIIAVVNLSVSVNISAKFRKARAKTLFLSVQSAVVIKIIIMLLCSRSV